MITVTHSSIECFRSCHTRYFYEYDECIKPKKKSWALIDGEALHKGLEVYYTKGFVEANQAIKHIYETKASYAVDDVEGNTEVLFHLNIISTMFLGYSYLYSMTEFEEYTPEVKGLVTIDNSYSNEPFNLAYRTDARVKKGEVLYLLETKTTSAYSLERYLEELRLDDQADTYLYCERQNNYPAIGVIYNIIRKPKLRQSKYESDEGFMNRIKKVTGEFETIVGLPKTLAQKFLKELK